MRKITEIRGCEPPGWPSGPSPPASAWGVDGVRVPRPGRGTATNHWSGRLATNTAHAGFRRVVATCGLVPQRGAGPPRLHAFRHTLAVDALVDAHRRGLDVDARIAVVSTFLGHKDPLNTYWYLTASPQLMSAVSDRMAAALGRRTR